ncbi:hypothetical protein K7640_17010 [Micromonospora sp. PLK6-60]|uniref:hypothetical protein n=1 Tax=Micromonospora sp. PLK6-60 TaxID=2873383 RepID=UPI001CA5F886|nr:hypothetical protein [Micromonospora sp. PLK6-60]MBY8873538.1 hypothetical protein [Micromonospora sp. PLK6-60]
MLVVVVTVLLYVFGFVFLYGVIRLAVRHGMEDLESRRPQLLHAEQRAVTGDRAFMGDNAFLTGS